MSLLLIFLWLYISIFCHEMGHFIVSKMVGFQPYLVIVGSGKKLLNFHFLNSVIEFRIIPSGGVTYTSNLKLEKVKHKLAVMYLAGPLVNCCFCLLFSLVYTYYIAYLQFPGYLSIIGSLVYVEFFLFAGNLLPMDIDSYGKVISNDGKAFIDALTKTEQQFIQKLLGLDRYTNTQHSSGDLFNNSLITLQILYKAQAEFNKHNFSQVIDLLEPILDYPDILTRDKLYIIDILASIVINHGDKKYLDKANNWSVQAMELASDIKTIQGTRGAILVELGRYNEGKEMLLPLTAAGNEAIDIAVSCCYIAKADYYLGNDDQVKDWLNKAEQINAAHLILMRIKQEINY
ncbi:site-2 protease family protein [Anabaena sp. CCY 9910]|uniref:site-2 protease family protein n=1 Tax=Anabaena sp. CCY 9910 TaxID=3103870 RepID=UPI0039E08533